MLSTSSQHCLLFVKIIFLYNSNTFVTCLKFRLFKNLILHVSNYIFVFLTRIRVLTISMTNNKSCDVLLDLNLDLSGTSFHAKLLHRIVGGQLTTIERFPYQALLQSNHYFCGGAILTKTVILTAAHCATGPPRNLIVFVGITYLSERKTSYRYRVEHYFIHDQYLGKATPEYDVAILRLSTSLVFSSKIQSIALPTRTYEEGQQVVATGWGQTELKPSSNQLKYINLTIGESPKCKPRIGAICTFDETKSVCKVRLQIQNLLVRSKTRL